MAFRRGAPSLDNLRAELYNSRCLLELELKPPMMTVRNPSRDPFYNQAFEEVVFERFADDEVFFLWQNDPAVVVGSYQNICREVHVPSLRRMGVPVVRRSSGGGTVYHDGGNVNYTYITRSDGQVDYDRCLSPVIDALNRIGVPARKGRTCDIVLEGRKISGSAQRQAHGRVLHHGTLLFQSDLSVLDQITTRRKNDCFRTKGTLSDICTVTNIADHLETPMTLEEFKARLTAAMVPADAPHIELSAGLEAEVRRLRDEKYRSWEWTWGKTPAFTYEKTGAFAGAPIRVAYQARRGILSEAQVQCPALDGARAEARLSGARLYPDGFARLCTDLAGERADELLDFFL